MFYLLPGHERRLQGCLELTESSYTSYIKNLIFTTTSKISRVVIIRYFDTKQRLIAYNERGKKGVIFTFIEDRLARSLVRSSGRPHGAKRDSRELPKMKVGQLVRYFEYPPDHRWNGKLAIILGREGAHREYKKGNYQSDWSYYLVLIEGQVESINGKYLFEVDQIDEL